MYNCSCCRSPFINTIYLGSGVKICITVLTYLVDSSAHWEMCFWLRTWRQMPALSMSWLYTDCWTNSTTDDSMHNSFKIHHLWKKKKNDATPFRILYTLQFNSMHNSFNIHHQHQHQPHSAQEDTRNKTFCFRMNPYPPQSTSNGCGWR